MENKKFLPREGDLPIGVLLSRANEQIELDKTKGIRTEVHFKFTCENCGERCMYDEPNKLYQEGECHKCGHKTQVTVGGYTTFSYLHENRNS